MAKFKRQAVYGPLAPDKYLTAGQVTQLRGHLDRLWQKRSTKYGNRREAKRIMIVDVLLNTGLRASELCRLQLQDLPSYHGKTAIHVRNSKGQRTAVVEISTDLQTKLATYIKGYRKNAKPKSYLFTSERGGRLKYASLYSLIKRIGRAAGIEYLHPHVLRHTFGTQLYSHSGNLLFVQDQLRHKDVRTTTIYAKTADETRRKLIDSFRL